METIEATVRLNAMELMKILKQLPMDRRTSMIQKYGEACTKTTAAKLISCSTQTINTMLKNGKIMPACGGTRVDVRSLAEYIENRGERNREARMSSKGKKKYV